MISKIFISELALYLPRTLQFCYTACPWRCEWMERRYVASKKSGRKDPGRNECKKYKGPWKVREIQLASRNTRDSGARRGASNSRLHRIAPLRVPISSHTSLHAQAVTPFVFWTLFVTCHSRTVACVSACNFF